MKNAFRYSLKHSIPILIGFIPVGLAYGVLMQANGLNWLWTGASSILIFAGSLQFLAVSFFAGGVSLITVAIMALLLNSRHIFYGIPFIEKWKDYGPWKLFLIYALPDEAFSLHCSNDFDDGDPTHKKWTYIFDALLVLIYWVTLSVLGALIGSLIPFRTDGIDFALTALFIVILLEQLKSAGGKAALGHICNCRLRRLYVPGARFPVSPLPGGNSSGTGLNTGEAFADGDHNNAGILLSAQYQLF